MRKLLAGLITAAVLGLMVRSALVGPPEDRGDLGETIAGDRPAPEAPDEVVATAPGRIGPEPLEGAEQCVRSLLDSAREGDVDAYLAAFDGRLEARLRRQVDEQGAEAFSRQLREA